MKAHRAAMPKPIRRAATREFSPAFSTPGIDAPKANSSRSDD